MSVSTPKPTSVSGSLLTSVLVTSALRYAALCFPVLPLHTPTRTGCTCGRPGCDRPGKHPRYHPRHFAAGLHQASTDPDLIRLWWRIWPDANIGLRTGICFDVCDIDHPHGLAALRHLLRQQRIVGPTVRTGSGGWHLYLAPTGHGNRVNLLAGVDWRGDGGYVVAPPSRHASGRRYEWRTPITTPLPACPPVLADLLTPPPLTVRSAAPVRDLTRYAAAALTRETYRILAAPRPHDHGATRTPGGRNHALNNAAYRLGQLVAAGVLDEHHVVTALTHAALRAGLSRTETARTLHSGLHAGKQHPRPDIRRPA